MKNPLGAFLDDMRSRSADVRDAVISSYEGNGIYLCTLFDTGATVRAVAAVNLGLLAVGAQCVVAPMGAGGAANALWRIVSADTAPANFPTTPPRGVGLGPTLARISANPTILTAGGAVLDVIVEGSGLTAAPTYGDPGIVDWLSPEITSTRVTTHVKAVATVATGTVTTTGTSVVGVGTNFTHFASGQLFILAGQSLRIDTITDDTHLTLTAAPGADVTDSPYSVGYPITAAGVTIDDFFQVVSTAPTAAILYGTASATGAHDGGTVFVLDTSDNSVTPLYSFDTTVDSAWSPFGPPVLVGRVIYFCCISDAGSSFGTVFKFNLDTSVLTLVHAFAGTDGSGLYAGLLDVAGIIYGVTYSGGAHGAGTLYKINPATDTFTSIYDFDPAVEGQNSPGITYDGTKIYGVTASPSDPSTIFSVDPATDALTILYTYDATYYGSFGSPALESANSVDGDTVYIVSQVGGTDNVGCIDKFVVSTNTRTRPVEFTAAGDMGARPEGSLSKVGSVFYGNTNGGGTSGDGTIFKFNPIGPTLTAVVQFAGANGNSPTRGGLLDFASKLWIVTANGGGGDFGVAGQLDPSDDSYAVLHEFVSAEGSNPFTRLVPAS